MSDLVIGKPVAEAMTISQAFLELMQSKGQGQPTRACSRTRWRSSACRSTPPG